MSRKQRNQKFNKYNRKNYDNDELYESSNNDWRRQRPNRQNNYNENDGRTDLRDRLGPRQDGHQNNYKSRSGKVRGHPRQNNQKSHFNAEEFFKITIPHGNKYEESYLTRLLRENLDDMDNPTVFYNFFKGPGSVTFYIAGREKADALKALSRRISTDSGQRLVIFASPSAPPNFQLNEQYLTLIKQAMSLRFDQQHNILNLSRFRDCEIFTQNGLYVMLNRPNVLRNIVDLIQQNTPSIFAINLSDNRLQSLEPLKTFTNLQHLKALDLSKNKINTIDELDHLKDLNPIELVLEGNPFVERFQTPATYVSAVRKIFKNLKTLDKEDLPDQIGFDLGSTEDIPQTKGSFIPDNTDLKNFISGFLKEYYRMYDSETRRELTVAYHDSATFSLSVSQSNNMMYKPHDVIMKESHNIFRIRDETLWIKSVKTTNLDIVAFLDKLPVTKHLLDTFQVDIPFFTKEFINVVVNGLFQETCRASSPLRCFCRTFFLIPFNNGFAIINDMFLICSPSMKQINEHKSLIESAKKSSTSTINKPLRNFADTIMPVGTSETSSTSLTSSISSPSTSLTNLSTQPGTTSTNFQREEIIQKFKQVTKMNRQFSIQCLEENNFDPNLAYDVFIKLQQANALPPAAFIGD